MRHACKIVTVLVLAAFPLLGEKQHIRLAMLEGEMLQRYSAEIERRLNKNLATMLSLPHSLYQ